MKVVADFSRLLASPKATAVLGVVILVFIVGIGLYKGHGRSEAVAPASAAAGSVAAGDQAALQQAESDQKTLESIQSEAPATQAPAVGGNPGDNPPLAPPNETPPTGQTYTVVGIEAGDALNVRSGPGVQNPVIARLPIAYSGVELTGAPVNNGATVWVPIKIGTLSGWVARKNLSP